MEVQNIEQLMVSVGAWPFIHSQLQGYYDELRTVYWVVKRIDPTAAERLTEHFGIISSVIDKCKDVFQQLQ